MISLPSNIGIIASGYKNPFSQFDIVMLSMPNLINYWPMNDKDPVGAGGFDALLLAMPNVINYYPMNDKDPLAGGNFDGIMATMPNLLNYYPMNDIDTV